MNPSLKNSLPLQYVLTLTIFAENLLIFNFIRQRYKINDNNITTSAHLCSRNIIILSGLLKIMNHSYDVSMSVMVPM